MIWMLARESRASAVSGYLESKSPLALSVPLSLPKRNVSKGGRPPSVLRYAARKRVALSTNGFVLPVILKPR
jgi:hypothetical protein